MGSACPARERSGQTLFDKGSVFEKIALHPKIIMYFSRVCLLTSGMVALSSALPSPATGVLRSQYPEKPIENPANWAWGQHPRNGLGYNAEDDLELEVCLANPNMIATPKCKIPLDICLENPEWLPLVGCSAHYNTFGAFPLDACLAYPTLLTKPACQANLTPQLCASTPSITRLPACTTALVGYEATLFDCQDNKDILCSLNMCAKHEFLVKC